MLSGERIKKEEYQNRLEENSLNTMNETNRKINKTKRTYLISEEENKIFVYAWIVMETYYEENNEIKQNSGSSIPYKIELTKENDEYVLMNYEIPRDGSYYAKDMKNLFLNSVLKDMNHVHQDGTIEMLQFAIKEQVELYFHNEK